MALIALDAMHEMIVKHHDLINVCMVDFITRDVFSLVDESIRQELLALGEDELCALPQGFVKTAPLTSPKSNLEKFIAKLGEYSVDSLGASISLDELLVREAAPKEGRDDLMDHFDRIMSEKKMHEVMLMSETVHRLARMNDVKHLVDLGSGKAYLSQVLVAKPHDMKVLAIDGSSVNSRGAEKRSDKLKKSWSSLLRRAKCRKEFGMEPSERGKNWKAKAVNGTASNGLKEEVDSYSPENLKIVTQRVDSGTDLHAVLEKQFPYVESRFVGVVGLHTCGNLASDSLKVFLANERVKFCCNVGCCYHHLDEEFYRNPHLSEEQEGATNPSFPLSEFLRERSFKLGRNARMLAAQPMDRLVAKQPAPSEALLWRAILQVILVRQQPDIGVSRQQVGRIAAKCSDFVAYVRKAFDKLDLPLEMSDDEIKQTYSSLSNAHGHKLMAFYQLRTMFGPLVEGLILLDRLVYLQQQEAVSRAYLVKMFNAVISPRCYAIVAVKKGKI